MAARLQDVLHLVSWNGYSKDIEAAVSSTKETLTDDRLMFPFGIQQKYKDGKTRIQILIENNRIRAYDRIKELQKMAENSNHMPILKKALNSIDNNGESALTAAIKQKSSRIVQVLLDLGSDVNQTNMKGGTPLNLAENTLANNKDMEYTGKKPNGKTTLYKMVPSKDAKDIIDMLRSRGAVSIPEERFDYFRAVPGGGRPRPIIIPLRDNEYEWNRMYMRHDRIFDFIPIELKNDREPEVPKPKRLKSSLYKRQFGR
jgi:hypothetical protein